MEDYNIPDYAKSRDILRFDYTEEVKLELDKPIGKDGRIVKFLYFISTGDRIWYRKFDKEKGRYSSEEYTNFITLHDRFMKGELDLVCPLNDIIYVFGKIAKICKEKGIEHVIKNGLVSYNRGGHFSCTKGKADGKKFPPSISGCAGGRRAHINVINDIGKESTFGFDLERICEVIQIKYKSTPLFHKAVYEVRLTLASANFSKFLNRYMKEHFQEHTHKFDEVFKEFLRKFNDEELERLMENEKVIFDDVSSILRL